MTSESSYGIVKSPAKTHRKGNAFVVNALGLVPPGIVLMMVVFSSSPRQRKPVWMSMSLKRLSATVLMMLPKSRILKEALSGFVTSCNASYHP